MTLDELNAKGVLADVFFAYDSVELNPDARADPAEEHRLSEALGDAPR